MVGDDAAKSRRKLSENSIPKAPRLTQFVLVLELLIKLNLAQLMITTIVLAGSY